MITVEDVKNVLHVILTENRGNILSESMCVGIRETVDFYLRKIDADCKAAMTLENQNGTME